MLSLHSGGDILPQLQDGDESKAPAVRRQSGDRPLAGRHVALTWSVEEGPILTAQLETAGARVTPLFAGTVALASDTTALDAALTRLSRYDWIVLTRLAGVDVFARRLVALGVGPEDFRHVYIALLFPITARARALAALPPQMIPATVLADDIAAGLRDVAGKRILLLRVTQLHDTLAGALRRRGAEVDDVEAFRILACPVDAQSLDSVLVRSPIDAIVCTGAAMAEGLLMGLAAMGLEPARVLYATPLIALDRDTAARLRQAGLHATVAGAAVVADVAMSAEAVGTGSEQPLVAALAVMRDDTGRTPLESELEARA